MAFLARRLPALMSRRCYTTRIAPPERKVTILGAGGGIGQPLAMLLKLNPLVTYLSLYDVVGSIGVAADVGHISSRTQVLGYVGEDQLARALDDSDLVIVAAGVARKPGMTRDDLFNINAGIVRNLCISISRYCPRALVHIISNPVNSTVPIAAEIFKNAKMYDPQKLFGVTTLDVIRARTFYATKKRIPVDGVDVPVIGGHSGITILPLFSQATPRVPISDEDIDMLTKRTQEAGTEVVQAKAGQGSATLSMAYAASIFVDGCLKAINGMEDVVDCSYVASNITPLPFFASKVRIGLHGIEDVLGLGQLSEYERNALEALKPELRMSIEKGINYAKNS
eukprot:c29323_g3_i1 orf=326-1342(+)